MMIPICSASLMKFGEPRKMLNVGIFLWKKLTFLNGLEFHMHVSDDDFNMFCKFDEIRWILNKNVEISYFKGPALSAFFLEIS